MLTIKKGNLLDSTENLILHQVNEYGSMGGGLAFQIAQKYPHVEFAYQEYCKGKSVNDLLGNYVAVNTDEDSKQYIINCFTQKDFNTDYEAMEKIFTKIKKVAQEKNYTIAMPYKMGCGIAEGDWSFIEEMLIKIFDDHNITIYKYEV